MQFSIIIVNYNVKYFLQLCLQSVQSAIKNIQAEVFVVDNNSTDGSLEMVQSLFPWVKIIANTSNLGFGVANNQAIALASGKYILLQNPDTVVAEDTYTRIIDFMELRPDAGGLGVKMIDGIGKFLPESKRGLPTPEVAFYKIFGLSVLFPKSRIFGKYHLGFLDNREINQVDVLSGAFMLIRKEVIDKIGSFDEQFFMYGEDIDLSFRISEAGYKNYYYPGTTIIHYKGESTKKGSLNYVFVFYKAMIIFARKHFASQKAALFSLLINSAVFIRAGIALVFRSLKLFTWPLIDSLLMTVVMLLVIPWYETIKFNGAGKFPESLYFINLPIYIFLWLAGLFFTNNYSRPFPKITSMLYGIVLGTVSISVVYAFLGEDLRASRAIILLGGITNLVLLILIRWVSQMINYRHLGLYNKNTHRIIVIGDAQEVDALRMLLSKNTDAYSILGFAGTKQEEECIPEFLGHFSRLPEILKLYKTEELIFVTDKISWKEVIAIMEVNGRSYNYKFFNKNSFFALGSNSKNAAGEVFTSAINFGLNSSEAKYNKRFTDMVIALVVLAISPILFLWVNKKWNFLSNIMAVLRGKKTWIGFADHSNQLMPKIKSHILKTTYELDTSSIATADLEYAKNYTSLKDVITILRNIPQLGD